ncbi:MAG: ATP-binding protein [Deferrisomatales bacterium]
MGLSIAQAIVVRHGGTIQVESRPGEGACFTVRLPLAGPPPPALPQPPPAEGAP